MKLTRNLVVLVALMVSSVMLAAYFTQRNESSVVPLGDPVTGRCRDPLDPSNTSMPERSLLAAYWTDAESYVTISGFNVSAGNFSANIGPVQYPSSQTINCRDFTGTDTCLSVCKAQATPTQRDDCNDHVKQMQYFCYATATVANKTLLTCWGGQGSPEFLWIGTSWEDKEVAWCIHE